MDHRDQDTNPELDPEPKSTAWAVDDDVLDLIIDAAVNEDVANTLAETRVATIVRQQRCKRLQSLSWQFAVSLIPRLILFSIAQGY